MHPNSAAAAAVSNVEEISTPFAQLGLNDHLLKTLNKLGFETPTPIQEQAIPLLLAGKDLVGLAQTGTGKTAAFLLPIIHQILAAKSHGRPAALIVVPTRELADQALEVVKDLTHGTHLRSISIYGGVSYDHQRRQLHRGVDIVVGCPGRLLDLISQDAIKVAGIKHLVLDEADQMFDMGFIVPIKRLLALLPDNRQSMLFSATMPEEIEGLCQVALKNPEKVQVSANEAASTSGIL